MLRQSARIRCRTVHNSRLQGRTGSALSPPPPRQQQRLRHCPESNIRFGSNAHCTPLPAAAHHRRRFACVCSAAPATMADELGLPKSNLQKGIKDNLPADMRIAGDATDLIVQACNQFVHLVSTQANDIRWGRQRSLLKLCLHACLYACQARRQGAAGTSQQCSSPSHPPLQAASARSGAPSARSTWSARWRSSSLGRSTWTQCGRVRGGWR